MSRIETALAEIERRKTALLGWTLVGDKIELTWVLDVLRGDRAVLMQHYENGGQYKGMCICSSYSRAMRYPCPDAARVLDRYAPEAAS